MARQRYKTLDETHIDEWLAAIHGDDVRFLDTKDNPVSSYGVISVIAKRMGVSNVTVYRARDKWKSIADAIQQEREAMKDFAESKIYTHIAKDNVAMTIFYAKTQMRDRGYIEKLVIEGNINITLINDAVKALEDSGIDATEYFQDLISRVEARKRVNASK